MYDANQTAMPPEPGTAQGKPIEFHGQAGEYFKIWIVNLVLSVLTLGIYSAWAKVRTKRYLYGNTRLDGASFEYHARPLQILKGRLIAAAVFLAYSLAGNLHPIAGAVMTLVWFLFLPWVVNLSLRFNARMTSWRNVHFDFAGSYGQSLLVFVFLPFICILPMGLLLPVAHREAMSYLAKNYRFGGKPFRAELPLGRFYAFFFQMVLIGVLVPVLGFLASAVLGGVANALLTRFDSPQNSVGAIFAMLGVFLLYGSFLFLIPAYQAKVRNLVYNNLKLEGGHGFSSTLNPWKMAWIRLSNMVVIALSLGFLYPWARIRATRYLAQHTAVLAAGDLSGFTSVLAMSQQAAGAELSDMIGLDIGL